jgi:hypothetical protein
VSTRFYGLYRGVVVDNRDPSRYLRLRARIPAVFGDDRDSPWAAPCAPPGHTDVPEIGARVWVAFEGGDPDNPIWVGVFYTPDSDRTQTTREP